MRLSKRKGVCGVCTFNVVLIPTIIYLVQKVIGVQHNQYEWLWWTYIPTSVLIWVLVNYKIIKR